MAQVFISYGRENKDKLVELLGLFQRAFREHNFWYDRELGAGTFRDQLVKQINRSKVFVFLVSEDSAKSYFCQKEYEQAIKKRKSILPIFIEDQATCLNLLPVEIQRNVQDIQFVVIPDGKIDSEVLAELYGLLGNLLGHRTPWLLIATMLILLSLVIAFLGYRVATGSNEPEILIQAANEESIEGSVKPDFLCSDLFKVVVYVKTDKWYVQPNQQGIAMNTETCDWEVAPGGNWDEISEIAVHLAPKEERYPASLPANITCPPLNNEKTMAVGWHCFSP
jgi:hypothetical protein